MAFRILSGGQQTSSFAVHNASMRGVRDRPAHIEQRGLSYRRSAVAPYETVGTPYIALTRPKGAQGLLKLTSL